MLAPEFAWDMRGYRLFLDDVSNVWEILGSGESLEQRRAKRVEPGTIGHLDAMLKAVAASAQPSPGRLILVHDNGTGSDATRLEDVAKSDVVAFTVAGPGAIFHVDRVRETGWIDWQDVAVGHSVIRVLDPCRVRPHWKLAWKPYRVRFMATWRAERREQVKHRWTVVGVVAGVVSAAAAVLGLITLL